MNIEDINRAFVYNRGMTFHKKAQAEIDRERLENFSKVKQIKAEQRRRRLVKSIQSHFKNLEKFVKEVFAEPSELSQFLVEKVLSVPGCRLIARQKFVECEKKDDNFPTLIPDVTLSVSIGNLEKEYFAAIDLVKIESLSNEKSEYFISLIVPNNTALGSKPRNDLRDIELVVYEHRCLASGFESDEETYLSYPPANVELRESLKSLRDLNVLCEVLLNRYQHLITS
jgi:hypothetical protein